MLEKEKQLNDEELEIVCGGGDYTYLCAGTDEKDKQLNPDGMPTELSGDSSFA